MKKDLNNAKQLIKELQSKNRLKFARAGEVWSVNDKDTAGHKSVILSNNKADRKKGEVKHSPITHAPTTRKMKNIILQENPDHKNAKKGDKPSYILPKAQISKNTVKAQKRDYVKIKNPIDKSIRRHIQKVSKGKK
ncbi:MAG: hypothetical protein IJA88_00155 [Clostridia bacterium]|nr:hypothetical protein [Clostridia bacterium]